MKNSVVVITGAASGIGAALCEKFGREGARIALLDMDEEGLQAGEARLSGLGIETFARRCDITDAARCRESIEAVMHHFGGIDVLINNAGITQRGAFMDAEIAMYRRVMEVNFFGALNCTKAAASSLVERKGMIIVTSSIAGLAPVLGRTGYCASKHALHGFFDTLRAEMKPRGVHVMIVCPGFTKTHLQERALGGDGTPTFHPQSKVGREASPDDVAWAVYRAAVKRKNLVVLTAVGRYCQMLWIEFRTLRLLPMPLPVILRR